MTHEFIDQLSREILLQLGEPYSASQRRRLEDFGEIVRLAHLGLTESQKDDDRLFSHRDPKPSIPPFGAVGPKKVDAE